MLLRFASATDDLSLLSQPVRQPFSVLRLSAKPRVRTCLSTHSSPTLLRITNGVSQMYLFRDGSLRFASAAIPFAVTSGPGRSATPLARDRAVPSMGFVRLQSIVCRPGPRDIGLPAGGSASAISGGARVLVETAVPHSLSEWVHSLVLRVPFEVSSPASVAIHC